MKEDNDGPRGQEVITSRNLKDPKIWRSVWGLEVKNKLKHFVWKCLHRAVPVNAEIQMRTKRGDGICRSCGLDKETVEHLFFFCPKAMEVWKLTPLQWDGIQHLRSDFWKWWEYLQNATRRLDGKKHITLSVYLLWHLWKARNEWCFNSKQKDAATITNLAMREWLETEEVKTRSRESD